MTCLNSWLPLEYEITRCVWKMNMDDRSPGDKLCMYSMQGWQFSRFENSWKFYEAGFHENSRAISNFQEFSSQCHSFWFLFIKYVYRGFKPVPSELNDGDTDPRQKGMKMECVFNGQTYERSNSSTQLAYMFIGNGDLRKPKITELPGALINVIFCSLVLFVSCKCWR